MQRLSGFLRSSCARLLCSRNAVNTFSNLQRYNEMIECLCENVISIRGWKTRASREGHDDVDGGLAETESCLYGDRPYGSQSSSLFGGSEGSSPSIAYLWGGDVAAYQKARSACERSIGQGWGPLSAQFYHTDLPIPTLETISISICHG